MQNLTQVKLTKINGEKLVKKVKTDKLRNYCDVIIHQMASCIINFILEKFQLPYNEDLLRLICENSSSYMNKVKPFSRVEVGASEKSAGIDKIRDKIFFLLCT